MPWGRTETDFEGCAELKNPDKGPSRKLQNHVFYELEE